MKIVFMGTPDFAMESLKYLYEKKHNILASITNPDRPQGRGMKYIPSPVKQYSLEHNIPVYQPEKVKNNKEILDKLKSLNPDVICVVAYGKILPKEILDMPKFGCINVHASLLPKYRGAAPIQWAVLNGDKKTGVTTMYMDEGMDTGDIILKQEVEISDDETTGQLWDKLSKVGAKLLADTLDLVEKNTAPRQKQPEDFTMAPMLKKEMSEIDWENKNASEIKNLVRGLNPIMGAYSYLDGKKIKFWKVEKVDETELFEKDPELKEYGYKLSDIMEGTVLLAEPKKGLYIKAKDCTYIKVLEIQGENAKKMDITSFLIGNKIMCGSVFTKN